MQLQDVKFGILLKDLQVRSVLTRLLRGQGATVFCAENENEMRIIIETMKPDITIVSVEEGAEWVSLN